MQHLAFLFKAERARPCTKFSSISSRIFEDLENEESCNSNSLKSPSDSEDQEYVLERDNYRSIVSGRGSVEHARWSRTFADELIAEGKDPALSSAAISSTTASSKQDLHSPVSKRSCSASWHVLTNLQHRRIKRMVHIPSSLYLELRYRVADRTNRRRDQRAV